ncbi:MAG: MFS transporter [Acidiferrobacterales bacterium]|nr:MFS transporter [Acidiferrobacterales bacterium]
MKNKASREGDRSIAQRYFKLAVLVIVAGNIYPLIYLRQNFEVSLLEAFNISTQQLGDYYATLGAIYMLTYLPSGWLADRIAPRVLMSFSMLFAGLLGVWFATLPSHDSLTFIFAGWGITAGLTFWAALIKATTLLAKPDEQGRFFGILDGGRGLVEAALATIAVAIFAYYSQSLNQDTPQALQKVIWLYVGMMLALAPITYFAIGKEDDHGETKMQVQSENLLKDLKTIGSKPELWLCAFCILAGYQLFWATYSFSAYLQNHFGLTAVAVGSITVAKLWMRPIGAAAAGFAGDFLNTEIVLCLLLIASSVALASLAFLPTSSGVAVLLGMVLLIGLLTYAVRGIFWATLESCDVPNSIKGLAIGVISLIGYSPDFYLPKLSGYLLTAYDEKTGYIIYFCLIAGVGVLGALAAWQLKRIASRRPF